MSKKKIRSPKKQFRSKAEKQFAKYLRSNSIHYDYERETFKYDYNEVRKYTPDFFLKKGIIIEFKGRFQGADRKKLLMVRAQWPNLDLRLVFQRNNPINKGSETKCSDWCNRYGFKYHVGISLPQEWIEELKR